MRKGTLVLSSHTSFDEVLTVGWNTVLAERLGIKTTDCLCVQGYKGDPQRKIGIVGQVSTPLHKLLGRIQVEFGESELAQEGHSGEISIVAIMNAFNEDEVHRKDVREGDTIIVHKAGDVIPAMAQKRGWIAEGGDGSHVLYLTGQPRASGIEAAKALGMSVACVGHRQAEDWGIHFLGEELRKEFPGTQVKEIYEEEIPIVREKKVPIVQHVG